MHSTQNGSHLEIRWNRILIHTLELKFCPHTTWGAWLRAHSNVTTFTRFWSKLKFRLPACIAWVYYASNSTMWWFLDNFFYLVCPLLERKKISCAKNVGELGALNTWGDNLYTGTQNGSKHEIWHEKFLIHALEFKLRPFEVSPYVCIGGHAFPPTRAHRCDDLYPIWSKLEYKLSACIVWLY